MEEMMGTLNSIQIFILASIVLLSANVQAHSADTFTVVIKETGLTPNSSQIVYNDSVIWHNVDSNENITHRIVYDGDGDGLFNGSNDWDSGELVPECNQTGVNNTSECNVTFLVWFNGTFGVGVYEYQDLLSNGTVYNGTIIVTEDIHPDESLPQIGAKYGESNDDSPKEISDSEGIFTSLTAKDLLLISGVSTAVMALILILLIIVKPNSE
ncbi:MAG: hypothetical protein CMB49_03225 [Euryarchaeota archaeon]|nr:hypothetical protein [Euryarchaeota archaeon]